jgi:hypothetical protein
MDEDLFKQAVTGCGVLEHAHLYRRFLEYYFDLDLERFQREHKDIIKETENANEYLRAEGFDPEEIGKQGQTFVRVLTRSLKMESALRELIDRQDYETIKRVKEVLDEYKKV